MEPNEEVHLEKDELTGDNIISGHDYDGIQELDNKLPKWWVWLFYLTIIIAVVYFLRFEILGTGPTQQQEYEDELASAGEKYRKPEGSQVDAAKTMMLLTDETALAAGKGIYDKNCSVCHLAEGQGLVGPNMTDEYWIHGCSFEDIYNIVVVGVPAKGMISWKDQLSPVQIQQVCSFIVGMAGTNPPNPKEPQGEKCEM